MHHCRNLQGVSAHLAVRRAQCVYRCGHAYRLSFAAS